MAAGLENYIRRLQLLLVKQASLPALHTPAENGKNIGILVYPLIMVVDIVAGVLGIKAEVAQNKVEYYRVWIFECRGYQVFKFGLAATALSSLAHVIANLLGGCICITSKEELDQASPNKQLAAASLVVSWILLAVAFTMLISGTLAN